MPRPKRQRRMEHPPVSGGFKPIGIRSKSLEDVYLELDEYESIKLCDYEGLNQLEAAKIMHVSRPTLTRIYASARKKVATALVEGRSIIIAGGTVGFEDLWYRCQKCHTVFNDVTRGEEVRCPRCASDQAEALGNNMPMEVQSRGFRQQGSPGFCSCSSCGSRISHKRGVPCSQMLCPNCGEQMQREVVRESIGGNAMIWAIPSLGQELSSSYNSRFAKSPFFCILEQGKTHFVANPYSPDEKQVGPKVLQFLKTHKVNALVVDYLGDKALEEARDLNLHIRKCEKHGIEIENLLIHLKLLNNEK